MHSSIRAASLPEALQHHVAGGKERIWRRYSAGRFADFRLRSSRYIGEINAESNRAGHIAQSGDLKYGRAAMDRGR